METIDFRPVSNDSIEPTHYVPPAFTTQCVREIAKREQSGWYVARCATGWAVGEMRLDAPCDRYPLLNNDQKPVVFSSVDAALQFLREECLIFNASVYHR